MKGLLIVSGVVLVLVVLLALYLSTVPNCTCGQDDCGGGCVRSKRRSTGTR